MITLPLGVVGMPVSQRKSYPASTTQEFHPWPGRVEQIRTQAQRRDRMHGCIDRVVEVDLAITVQKGRRIDIPRTGRVATAEHNPMGERAGGARRGGYRQTVAAGLQVLAAVVQIVPAVGSQHAGRPPVVVAPQGPGQRNVVKASAT